MLCNSLVVSVVLYFYYTQGRPSGLKETGNGKWGTFEKPGANLGPKPSPGTGGTGQMGALDYSERKTFVTID